MKRILLFLLTIGIIASVLCACKSDEAMIEDRMNTFVSAFNSGDMEAVLECFDAKTRNAYKAIFSIGDGLIGMTGFEVGLSDLFGLSVGLVSEGELLQVEDLQITINSESSRATVTGSLCYSDVANSYDQTIQLTMVKENGDWFITP